MNRTEIAMVVILFGCLIAWSMFLAPRGRGRTGQQQTTTQQGVATNTATAEEPAAPVQTQQTAVAKQPAIAPPVDTVQKTNEPAATPKVADEGHRLDEQTVVLSNEYADVRITSWGGAVKSVKLKQYSATLDAVDEKVNLDFAASPALALRDVPGLTTNNDFQITLDDSGKSVRVERLTSQGVRFTRSISIGENYSLRVHDVYSNETEKAVTLPAGGIDLGPMAMIQTKAMTRGLSYLDVDSLADLGGARVRRWSKEFRKMFGVKGGLAGCARQDPDLLRPNVKARAGRPVIWGAVKNKFFVQILTPGGDEVADDCEVRAERDKIAQVFQLGTVSASLLYESKTLSPGETITRDFEYYAGPKKYGILSKLDRHRDKVMLHAWRGWGWFREVCILLLKTLNAINAVIPNYGVAIILLTIIVRVLFWPITHKGTENMKKMQKIQPLVTQIREKYKSDPQKMQQETMALYREHKVNPMMGCLPMLVQIPVFIALFTVLRSAVELRFAPFLWIADLSEPERLIEFGFTVPLIGWDCLNILPIVMTGTMVWQQKLTPSSGDPQQQKMMATIMPVMMLVLLYNMASALMLYWSVSQSLAILQLVLQKRKAAREEVGSDQ